MSHEGRSRENSSSGPWSTHRMYSRHAIEPTDTPPLDSRMASYPPAPVSYHSQAYRDPPEVSCFSLTLF